MYELVKTKRQERNFNQTWDYFCQTYGWHNDRRTARGLNYNLVVPRDRFLKRRRIIGTIEFAPYKTPSVNQEVDRLGRFNFMKFTEVRNHLDHVWEIDKVSILEEYQRKGYLKYFFPLIVDHAVKHQVIYYISLIELHFYRLLKYKYGTLIEKKGNAFITSSTTLIPTLIHIGAFITSQASVESSEHSTL